MKTSISKRFVSSVKRLVTLTCELISRREFIFLKVSFNLVEKMLVEGEPDVKRVLREIYLPGIKQYLNQKGNRQDILDLMPNQLRNEYLAADEGGEETIYAVFEIWLN